jgi:hypothetical protein
MRRARFKIRAKLDRAFPEEGTVEIDREASLFSVRPKRRRKRYELTLEKVASMVVASVCRAEAAELKKAKAEARRKK